MEHNNTEATKINMIYDFYVYHFNNLENNTKTEILEKIEKYGEWLKMANEVKDNTDPVNTEEVALVKDIHDDIFTSIEQKNIVSGLYEVIAKFEDAPVEKKVTFTFNSIHEQRDIIPRNFYVDLMNRLIIACKLADVTFPYYREVRKHTETFNQV